MEFNDSINNIYHPEEENIKAWYLHTKNYETETIEETYPYIGDYVYIGYKRCKNTSADRAITDVVVCEGKNPAAIKDIKKKDTSVTATYNLVAKIDLNKDAGGDYLYLIQVRSAEDSNYTGLIHTHVTYGILIMTVLAVAEAAVVYVKKKKENQQ